MKEKCKKDGINNIDQMDDREQRPEEAEVVGEEIREGQNTEKGIMGEKETDIINAGSSQEETKKRRKRKIIIGIAALIVITAAVIGGAFYWKKYNVYEPRKETFEVELGEDISKTPDDYIQAGNKNAVANTQLDLSEVNEERVGTYPVVASYKDKRAQFNIRIVDTTAPEIVLTAQAQGYKTIAGQAIPIKEIIESVSDFSGVENIDFGEFQRSVDTDSTDILEQSELVFPEAGEHDLKIKVKDNNGNEITQTITIKVVEDYITHVTGWTGTINVVKGTANVDWLEDISWDDRIKEVTPDASGVDLNTVGTYTIRYTILGDDGETTVIKEQTVNVTEDYGMPAGSSAGADNKKANNNNSSASKSGKSSSGSSNKSGGNSNSGSSSTNNEFTPGQSWEMNKTGEGYIGGGSKETNGNTYEEGTW